MKRSLIALTLALVVAMGFMGCSKDKDAAKLTALEKVKKAGKITIGTSPDYPPFESIDDKGNIVGFDIDLAKEVARELGVEAKFVSMGFDTIITAVKNGQVDLGVSSFSVNEERKLSIDFSLPYISSSQVILVKKGSPVQSKADLVGSVVAAQMGTTGAEAAKNIENAEIKTVDDYNVATMMLDNGSVKAVILDIAIAKELASRHEFKMVETPLNHEETAMVIRKGNDQLKTEIDKAIDKIMKDGRYEKIKDAWKVK